MNALNKLIDSRVIQDKNARWQKMLRNIRPGSRKLWSITKNLKKPSILSSNPMKIGDNIITNGEDKAQALADSFEKAHLLTHNTYHPNDDKVSRFIASFNNESIDPDEIEACSMSQLVSLIKNLKNNKSPGPDGIQNVLVKNLPPLALEKLLKILNACIKSCYWPKAFKQAKVTPIPKSGKDLSDPSNFRPISLLNVLSKILEKIILERINAFASANNVIKKEQFGFRHQHSTTHQLKRVTNHINNNKLRRKSTGLILLDVEKAFDSIWHDGLIYKMDKANFPKYLQKIVNAFLRERSFIVHLQGKQSSAKSIPAGCPQGSSLSPTLYSIFTADLKTPKDSEVAYYADDTGIFTSANRSNTIVKRLQKALDTIDLYFQTWKIKINGGKTQAIIFPFNNQRRRAPSLPLMYRSTQIEFAKSVKYLGVHLDAKLTFAEHIKYTRDKAHTCFGALYPLLRSRAHLDKSIKMTLFKSMIRPILTYASPVWTDAAQSHRKQLQVIQNKCIKTIFNLPWRQPSNSLHHITGLAPLDLFISTGTVKFISACRNSDFELIRALY